MSKWVKLVQFSKRKFSWWAQSRKTLLGQWHLTEGSRHGRQIWSFSIEQSNTEYSLYHTWSYTQVSNLSIASTWFWMMSYWILDLESNALYHLCFDRINFWGHINWQAYSNRNQISNYTARRQWKTLFFRCWKPIRDSNGCVFF